MKGNVIKRSPKRRILFALALLAFTAVAAGLILGYDAARSVWLEQSVIRDFASQVSLPAGNMVKADVLAEMFGLKPGANLAEIDFDACRTEILLRIPNLRAVNVARFLPDRVVVTTEERTPVARVNVAGRRQETGRVVDDEGVVFVWQRGSSMLPVIRESAASVTQPGKRLEGRAAAALRLMERARDAEFAELGILSADVSKPDFITATLGDYSTLKICWEGMDEPTPRSDADLTRKLTHLTLARRSRVATGTTVWNATDPAGRIYADARGGITK